jgi:hypothetical protein
VDFPFCLLSHSQHGKRLCIAFGFLGINGLIGGYKAAHISRANKADARTIDIYMIEIDFSCMVSVLPRLDKLH